MLFVPILLIVLFQHIGVSGLDLGKKLGLGFGQSIGILGKGDKDGGDARVDNCTGRKHDLHAQDKD